MSNWTEDQNNEQINDNNNDLSNVQETPNEASSKRHGCVTAWLLFGLIVSAIGAVMGLGFSDLITQLDGVDYLQPSYYIFTGLIAIVEFAGLFMLWKKRKWGFHVVVISAMFNGTLSYLVNHEWLSFTTPFLNVFLLYMVMQIAKDQHTAWSQLK